MVQLLNNSELLEKYTWLNHQDNEIEFLQTLWFIFWSRILWEQCCQIVMHFIMKVSATL